MAQYKQKTIEYKRLNGSQPVLLDVYFPVLPPTKDIIALPVVVNLHGGGLTMGNRASFFPTWVLERVMSMGFAFISADYRLLIPGDAKDVVEDLQDIFKFIANTEIQGDDYSFRLDNDRIAAVGGSAGGVCAYLAAIHCKPKPKVILSIYGMGGDFFNAQNLEPKEGGLVIMNRSFPRLDPAKFSSHMHPYTTGIPASETNVPVSAGFLDERNINNPRLSLPMLLIQEGCFLDYYTGLHSPSISETLRNIFKKGEKTAEDFKRAIPKDKHYLFPQFLVDSKWPPTILLHGTEDDAVFIKESHNMRNLVQEAGVPVELIEVPGEPHTFDLFPGAEEKHKITFDRVRDFIQKYL